MAAHTYRIFGRVDPMTGNSTIHPIDGSGEAGSWTIDTNPPEICGHYIGKDGEKHDMFRDNHYAISPVFNRHNFVVRVFNDEQRTHMTTPTSGSVQIEVTDNGIDWGTLEPDVMTFNGRGDYTRLNVCGVITNARVTIKGIHPRNVGGAGEAAKGAYVEVQIFSSN